MEQVVKGKASANLESLIWNENPEQETGKATVECTVEYDDDGNVVIRFPQTVDIAKFRQTSGGNVFIALEGAEIDLNAVMQVPGGDAKERVMVTYPFRARLNFKMK
jgi:hypothetical protein